MYALTGFLIIQSETTGGFVMMLIQMHFGGPEIKRLVLRILSYGSKTKQGKGFVLMFDGI